MVDSTQRQEGIQATALHELGHAFGLWGHSPDPADVMAAVPRAQPLLQLSPRDLATLGWLNQQPTDFGRIREAAPEP
jgi:predicted Zn-dependent protease